MRYDEGIHGGERLGVEPVLKAADMADPNVEHLGVMAYAAYFQWVKSRPKPCDRLRVIPEGKTVRVHNPVSDDYCTAGLCFFLALRPDRLSNSFFILKILCFIFR